MMTLSNVYDSGNVVGMGPGYSDTGEAAVSGTATLGTLGAAVAVTAVSSKGIVSTDATESLGWADTFTITSSSGLAKGTPVTLKITMNYSGKIQAPISGSKTLYMEFLPYNSGATPNPPDITAPGIYVSALDGSDSTSATLQVHVGDTFQLGARMNASLSASEGDSTSNGSIGAADGASSTTFSFTVNIDPVQPCISYETASGTVYFSGAAPRSCGPLQSPPSLPAGQAGVTYPPSGQQAQLVSGGIPPFDFSSIAPSLQLLGLTAASNTGYVTGTITTQIPDTYHVEGKITDASGAVLLLNEPLTVYCGNPSTKGDDRDALVTDYRNHGVQLHPGDASDQGKGAFAACSDFTTTHPEFNVSHGCQAYVKAWEVVQENLPPQVTTWRANANNPAINSAYRNPALNIDCLGSVSNSQHMHGDAVDVAVACQ